MCHEVRKSLQHATTRCNILQHATIRCNTLQHITRVSYCITYQCSCICHGVRETLQHTATHCNTLQHTATHYKQIVFRYLSKFACPPPKWHFLLYMEGGVLHRAAPPGHEHWPLFFDCAQVATCLTSCSPLCCSVLKCVAMCCGMLQCVAVSVTSTTSPI